MIAPEFIPTLFDSVDVVQKPQSAEEQFAAFRRRNPWFLSWVATIAFEQKSRGNRRGSMKAIFEQLRSQIPDNYGTRYRLNNNATAIAARLVMEQYPELDGFFETRARKS